MIRGFEDTPIGSRFADCTFESFEPANHSAELALSACQRLVSGTTEGVFLFGPVGTGKTHLLVATAKAFASEASPSDEEAVIGGPSVRELMELSDAVDDTSAPVLEASELDQSRSVEFWTMSDLIAELRAECRTDEVSLARRCRNCDLLIIDDLGQERVTAFSLEEFERIVDWRYRNEKPIAVSTNMELADLTCPEKYGQRAFSRWAGTCEIVKVDGSDYRAEHARKVAS